MTCDYCTGNCQHDDDAEGVIEWYQHWMNIPAAELAADYALRVASEDGEVHTPMREAMDQRMNEISTKLVEGDLAPRDTCDEDGHAWETHTDTGVVMVFECSECGDKRLHEE